MPNPGVSPVVPEIAVGARVETPAGHRPARHSGELIGGRYRLERLLREGARSQTWEATNVELAQLIAIEFQPESPHLQADAIGEVGELDAARTLARLRHPHLVEIRDFGQLPEGASYVVTELLVGETIGQLLGRRGCVAWARAVQIIEQVGSALAAAHGEGLVHGDLRPGNVFLVDTGEPGEFVKVVGPGGARGGVGGTPAFMSPEQCRGEPPDPRSDIYAIGCLLHALITGDPPFAGDPEQLRRRQINDAPKSLGERAPRQFIPAELEAIALRCLDKLPARRFADIRELMTALSEVSSFAAAAGMAAGVIRAPDAAARPMGYAGRQAPRDPGALGDRGHPIAQTTFELGPERDPKPEPEPKLKPRSQPTSKHGGKHAGPSVGAVLATVLGSTAAIVGVGLGGWWLVATLIAEPPATPTEQAEHAGARADTTADEASERSASPPASVPADTADQPGRPEPAHDTPRLADPAASDPVATATVKPAKPANSESKPKAEPEDEPKPKPKPSVKPDSKANEGIAHDDLVDPWN